MIAPADLIEAADHGSLVLGAEVNHMKLQAVPAAVYAVLARGVPVDLLEVVRGSVDP